MNEAPREKRGATGRAVRPAHQSYRQVIPAEERIPVMNARSAKRAIGPAVAAACHAGWRAARPAPWVVLPGDDVRVGPHWHGTLSAAVR
jgi:hypothetical protein